MKDIINFIGFRQNGIRLNGMTPARALRLRNKRDWTKPNIWHQQIGPMGTQEFTVVKLAIKILTIIAKDEDL